MRADGELPGVEHPASRQRPPAAVIDPVPLAGRPVGLTIIVAGIAALILLPVLRVVVVLGAFLRARDYRLAACAMVVLLFIALGFAVGCYHPT